MLEEYAKKRNFGKTPEPTDDPFEAGSGPLRFVVQMHDATRLHYDFRLELDGVLKSWAVPKGPSLNPADKRLAVHVEDHPLSYGSFEGVIPKGEYGAGEVIVWDEGIYSPDEDGKLSFDNREEAEERLRKEYEKGRMKITLRGQKLKGSWALVRSSRSPKDWLLIKHKDAFASEEDITKEDRSVITGRTVEDVRNGVPGKDVSTWTRDHEETTALTDVGGIKGAKKAPVPKTVAPMVPNEVDKAFSNPAWTFELKLDGVRIIAIKDGENVRLISRNNKEVNHKLAFLVKEIKNLPVDSVVLDGEIVMFNEEGKPSFQGLMERYALNDQKQMREWDAKSTIDYCIFDLIYLNGYDLKAVPLEKRRELLASLNPTSRCTRILDAFPEDGQLLYEQAQMLGLEGIVGKKLSSPYKEGLRSADWVKIKEYHSEEFLIGGFTEGDGARKSTFGSLMLGRMDEKGKLTYCGNVGGGFNDRMLDEVLDEMKPLIIPKTPFAKAPAIPGKKTWVEPKLVAEVRFQNWTKEGALRFPIFIRLRPDISVNEASQPEETVPEQNEPNANALVEALQEDKQELEIEIEGHKVRFTSLDRALWPATDDHPAITKRDLAIYLAKVADYMLPHLKDRPLSFVRFPDGIGGESFFQKHWDKGRPAYFETVSIWSDHNGECRDWLLCNNLPSLLWLAHMSSIEIHSWYSRVTPDKSAATQITDFCTDKETLERSILNYPDFMVFDLDPVQKAAKGQFDKKLYQRTIGVALALKDILDQLGLKGYLKTSGKSGIHIYIPLKRIYDYDEVKAMAETFGRHVMQVKPEDVTMEWQVKKRPDKIFFDHNQNIRGKTLINIYSTRPAPGATVSFPLKWNELEDADPRDFTIFTVPKLLEERGDIWADILDHKQVLA